MTEQRAATGGPRVAIIGAGFAGISAGYMLRRYGIDNFVILDRAPDIGGTWWYNRYPGAEVDTPSSIYSLSFSRWAWSRSHAQQAEILQYMNATVDRLGLRSRIRLGVEVRRAEWSESSASWNLTFQDGSSETFDAVISAVGFLDIPNMPEWSRNSSFVGEVYHAARWTDIDLEGKTVAVVGTGSTAVQVVGELPKQCGSVIVFQRQPNWILPKNVEELNADERVRRSRGLPYLIRRVRGFIASERGRVGGKAATVGTRANTANREAALAHLHRSLRDRPDLISLLTPDYPFNGKRPVINDTFYPALTQANVRLVPHAVASLEADAIVDAAGEKHPVDVVFLATGFKASEYLHDLEVIGRDSRSLKDVWNGEPRALAGVTVPGFPNFFILYGPNTNAGPVPFFLEAQARFAALALRASRRRRAAIIETKPRVEAWYDRWVQRRLAKTVWGGTRSYFTSESGRVVTQWPTGATQYWFMTRLTRWIGLSYQQPKG